MRLREKNMSYTIGESIRYVDDFLIYFGIALALFVAFIFIYTAVTPYKELKLIREGNTAASISLLGALIGFALPVASTVANAVNIVDMIVFAVVATVVQLIVFVVARMLLPGLSGSIEDGNTAKATFLAAISISVGLLNAAALVY
jgi:putative membrane protein